MEASRLRKVLDAIDATMTEAEAASQAVVDDLSEVRSSVARVRHLCLRTVTRLSPTPTRLVSYTLRVCAVCEASIGRRIWYPPPVEFPKTSLRRQSTPSGATFLMSIPEFSMGERLPSKSCGYIEISLMMSGRCAPWSGRSRLILIRRTGIL
jgi:hypothetical protein